MWLLIVRRTVFLIELVFEQDPSSLLSSCSRFNISSQADIYNFALWSSSLNSSQQKHVLTSFSIILLVKFWDAHFTLYIRHVEFSLSIYAFAVTEYGTLISRCYTMHCSHYGNVWWKLECQLSICALLLIIVVHLVIVITSTLWWLQHKKGMWSGCFLHKHDYEALLFADLCNLPMWLTTPPRSLLHMWAQNVSST